MVETAGARTILGVPMLKGKLQHYYIGKHMSETVVPLFGIRLLLV